eukprot:1302661-Pyramimonas_sp.AAC.1
MSGPNTKLDFAGRAESQLTRAQTLNACLIWNQLASCANNSDNPSASTTSMARCMSTLFSQGSNSKVLGEPARGSTPALRAAPRQGATTP